jgi:hypothetical protein
MWYNHWLVIHSNDANLCSHVYTVHFPLETKPLWTIKVPHFPQQHLTYGRQAGEQTTDPCATRKRLSHFGSSFFFARQTGTNIRVFLRSC